MQGLRKIWQRLTDPVFYRKRVRQLLRCCRKSVAVNVIQSVEELGELKNVCIVVAHPDDETFCSGLIRELVTQGTNIDLLCLTRGEGGPTGKWSREELGQVREEEMRNACGKLGIRNLVFLDHIDPEAKEHRVYAPNVSETELARQISPHLEGVDFAVTHGSSGEYWHPAHLLVHGAVKSVMGERRWVTFLAQREDHPIPKLVNLDDPAHLVLDVSGREEERYAALACHQSQVALFRRFADGELMDFVRKTSIETYCLRGRESG